MEAKEKRIKEDISYMFKRFTSHDPSIYYGTPDPRPLRIGFAVVRSYSMLSNALSSEK